MLRLKNQKKFNIVYAVINFDCFVKNKYYYYYYYYALWNDTGI